jgi:ABC-type Mn2+/Zn2+ transport system permease subunit
LDTETFEQFRKLIHAVLPGVALGFLWNLEKDPLAIFIGALLAGLAGSATVSILTRTTRLKEDTALGMVLASFFGLGLCLMSMFQRLPTGNKSGIETFLFGQAAALGPGDIQVMGTVTLVVVGLLGLGYKEFLLVSFDPGFARVLALPTVWFERLLVMLLAFSVVAALQAVGVVLVSAMLIIPAATASLLTDRFHRVLVWSSCLGMISGLSGAFLSFLGTRLPTGPFMVLSASLLFALALLFSPRQGIVPRWYRQRSQRVRIERENTLKAIYQVLESDGFVTETVTVAALAARRRLPPILCRWEAALRVVDVVTPISDERKQNVVCQHQHFSAEIQMFLKSVCRWHGPVRRGISQSAECLDLLLVYQPALPKPLKRILCAWIPEPAEKALQAIAEPLVHVVLRIDELPCAIRVEREVRQAC